LKRIYHIRITGILLSALILASTASVRSAKAEGPTPTASPEPLTILEQLEHACSVKPDADAACTAACAAEQMRYDEGLVSCLPSDIDQPRYLRLNAMFDASNRILAHSLTFDWIGWRKTLVAFKPKEYDCYAQNQIAFSTLATTLNTALRTAGALSGKVLSRDLRAENIALHTTPRQEPNLTWRESAALFYVFGEDTTRLLQEAFSVQQEGSAIRGVTIRWPNPSFADIAARGTKEQLVEAKLALYYLNTVYLDDGSVAPVAVFQFPKEYLATITHPVPGGVIKNGWYDPRSHRTRVHTGTDIRVSSRTPILSMTDGVVLHVGFLPIPGNYVIIRDPSGYEYHYYHMYELSTFVKEGDTVKQGQQIGRVGSTGNSVAYHLHVGLVSPDGVYLNPYDLFTQAGIGPVLGQES
jgi:murein DD-endopeptidase MepM/ murein hydrolase activator NlpD